ncbi:putative N-acetyl-beta-D-glucosaminide alpha-1 [Tieghemostelium lacteum]|uniref:Putative N-acetyl-beta-D-glucosaminide alpha-1 n=1 Tax=Tieghemostelium lacteum TaxID=361077 RepID=A0A152A393_TIELA|nr:putative N-acetyl-beta-D-glucosaminide alpha-1 [Tieghemostelium lacteum]|eukprot:KYR00674.1 putative N-acetyl-beta-D-glucosaminide alpha-1 [Tieghemostelium lacteum]
MWIAVKYKYIIIIIVILVVVNLLYTQRKDGNAYIDKLIGSVDDLDVLYIHLSRNYERNRDSNATKSFHLNNHIDFDKIFKRYFKFSRNVSKYLYILKSDDNRDRDKPFQQLSYPISNLEKNNFFYYHEDIVFSDHQNISNVVSHLLVEINDSDSIKVLMGLMDHLKNNIVQSIMVMGGCSLKSEIEMAIDSFLFSNRVWNYVPSTMAHTKELESFYCGFSKTQEKKEGEEQELILLHLIRLPNYTDSYKLYQAIDRVQHDCDSRKKKLIHQLNSEGMSASLHFLAYALTKSFEWNRTLYTDSRNYLYSNEFSDIFLPLTKCAWELPVEKNGTYKNSKSLQVVNNLNSTKDFDPTREISVITKDYNVYTHLWHPSKIPKGWVKDDSVLRFRSHVMNYMLRPNHHTRRYLAETREKVWGKDGGLSSLGGCIAVHIRNGDKIGESDIFYFDQYMTTIETASKYLNIHNVFVMSDNQTLFREPFDHFSRYPQFKFYYLSNLTRVNNHTNYLSETSQNPKEKTQIGLGVYTEVVLASECQYFVGTFTSNIGRLIIELIESNPFHQNLQNPQYSHLVDITYESIDESVWFINP